MSRSTLALHQSIDLPRKQGTVPIRCFTNEELLPDASAQRQLEELAALPGVEEYVTVLPDVHYKDRNPSPSGTVVVTDGVIVPRAIDGGINCGMRSMVTSIPAAEMTPEVIDGLFGGLLESVPLKAHDDPLVTEEECEEVLVHGLGKLVGPLGLPEDEVLRTENGGRMDLGIDPDVIRANLPEKPIRKYRGSIGALGAGNHFLELQEVVEICNPEAARLLGIELGAAMFMMHTDSRKLGKRILSPVHAEAEAMFRAEGQSELWTIPVDSEIGRRYLACLTATMHAGFANRAAITHAVRSVLGDLFGDAKADLRLVTDSGHETIQPEQHDGRTLWVHRHGASHVLRSPHEIVDPALAEIGHPVPLAGCLGMDSYVCTALPGITRTFHSGPHGAGRVLAKTDAAAKFDAAEVEADIRGRGVRLYRYHADNIAGQSPASFKNVTEVMGTMSALDLLQPVARLRPMAALKG